MHEYPRTHPQRQRSRLNEHVGLYSSHIPLRQQLFINFLQENANEPKKEFYIPFIVNSSIQDGSATVKVLSTPENWFGVTYQEDRPMVVNKLEELTEKGTYPKINLLPGLISSPTLTA